MFRVPPKLLAILIVSGIVLIMSAKSRADEVCIYYPHMDVHGCSDADAYKAGFDARRYRSLVRDPSDKMVSGMAPEPVRLTIDFLGVSFCIQFPYEAAC